MCDEEKWWKKIVKDEFFRSLKFHRNTRKKKLLIERKQSSGEGKEVSEFFMNEVECEWILVFFPSSSSFKKKVVLKKIIKQIVILWNEG